MNYSRKQIQALGNGFIRAGKVLSTRNYFFVFSNTGRRYKISVDINRKIPFSSDVVFSQIELEYNGKITDEGNASPETSRSEVVSELSTLRDCVVKTLNQYSVNYSQGGRKVDILMNLK